MRYAIKTNTLVKAYPLGEGHPMEKKLVEAGAIRVHPDGRYELFSQESLNGEGQIARAGDFFKADLVDGKYYPYPNDREGFLEKHTHIEGDTYRQAAYPMPVWLDGDPMDEEIRFLLDTGRLTLNEEDESRYFNAFLTDCHESRSRDGVVAFYGVTRENGVITDVNFNLIERSYFEANYRFCTENG